MKKTFSSRPSGKIRKHRNSPRIVKKQRHLLTFLLLCAWPEASTAQAQTPNLAACSPDGEFYAVATPNGRIKYGRTQDGATLRTFYQCHPRAVVFSPDGRLLAIADGSNGCPAQLKVWKVADGALLCKMETAMGNSPLLCVSQDGRLLASTDEGSRLNLWQLPQGTLKWSATIPQAITRITFADQGRAVVVVCADGSTKHFPVP